MTGKEKNRVFIYSTHKKTENFEAFWRVILSIVNLKFLHSDYKSYSIQRCATIYN